MSYALQYIMYALHYIIYALYKSVLESHCQFLSRDDMRYVIHISYQVLKSGVESLSV